MDKIVSALYLPQYSPDPFYIYTSYQATTEGVSRVKFFFKIQKFEILANSLNLFSLGIQYESIVWVIMVGRGYPQNTGVLVVLVLGVKIFWCNFLYRDKSITEDKQTNRNENFINVLIIQERRVVISGLQCRYVPIEYHVYIRQMWP